MCRPIEKAASSSGPKGGVFELSVGQLATNQRIYAAAIRRANAIERWLEAGIVSEDLCGGAFGAAAFDGSVVTGPATGDAVTPALPSPRLLQVSGAAKKGTPAFDVSARQLRINQAIAAAAVRRANALAERLDGRLTGGDVREGAIGTDRIAAGVAIVSATAGATRPEASKTRLAPKRTKQGAAFTLSAQQLGTNQRIGQAAIRRLNDIRREIESGLDQDNFAPGSISAANLTPGLGG